jgi:hypothetical protein
MAAGVEQLLGAVAEGGDAKSKRVGNAVPDPYP